MRRYILLLLLLLLLMNINIVDAYTTYITSSDNVKFSIPTDYFYTSNSYTHNAAQTIVSDNVYSGSFKMTWSTQIMIISGTSAYSRVYKNGIPYGIEHVSALQFNDISETFSNSIINTSDTLELWVHTESGVQIRAYNFNMSFDIDYIDNWYNTSYNYRVHNKFTNGNRPMVVNFTILNTTGTNNASYIFCNGLCKPDLSDIRFSLENTTALPFWVENATSGKVWVNVTGNGTVNMYYNNRNADNISNGNTTFTLFDDFSGAALDTTKWNSLGTVTASVANSQLTLGSGACNVDNTLKTYMTFLIGTEVEFFTNPGAVGGAGACKFFGTGNGVLGAWNTNVDGFYANSGVWSMVSNNAVVGTTNVDSSVLKHYTITRNTATVIHFFKDGVDMTLSPSSTPYTGSSSVEFMGGVVQTVEWVHVRTLASTSTSWSTNTSLYSNNYTNDQTLNLSVPKDTSVNFYFNGTVNNWVANGIAQGSQSNSFNYTFSDTSIYNNITVYSSNRSITWNVTAIPFSQLNVTLLTPVNGSLVTFNYPPQYGNIEFTWQKITTSGYNIQVSKDTNFNIIVVDNSVSTNTSTNSIEQGVYYWRVRTFNSGVGGNWSNISVFTHTPLTFGAVNYSAQGIVYQLLNGQISVISGAKVEIYNSTFYDFMITGSNGYYIFQNLAQGSTYTLKASKVDEFDDSGLIPVTATNGTVTTNILLQKCTSVFNCFYNKQFVTFAVQDIYFNRYSNVLISIYKNGELTVTDQKLTDSTGKATFLLVKNQDYTVTAVNSSLGISKILTIIAGDTYYVILVSPTITYFQQPNSADATLRITPVTSTINATHSYINITYLNTSGVAHKVNVMLNRTNIDTTQTTLFTTEVTSANNTFSFIVPNQGTNYVAVVKIYDDVGATILYNFKYGFTFPGIPSNPFSGNDDLLGMIAVGFLLFMATFFSESTAGIGAVIISAMAGILYGMGFMNAPWFGSYTILGVTYSVVPFAVGVTMLFSIIYLIKGRERKEGV